MPLCCLADAVRYRLAKERADHLAKVLRPLLAFAIDRAASAEDWADIKAAQEALDLDAGEDACFVDFNHRLRLDPAGEGEFYRTGLDDVEDLQVGDRFVASDFEDIKVSALLVAKHFEDGYAIVQILRHGPTLFVKDWDDPGVQPDAWRNVATMLAIALKAAADDAGDFFARSVERDVETALSAYEAADAKGPQPSIDGHGPSLGETQESQTQGNTVCALCGTYYNRPLHEHPDIDVGECERCKALSPTTDEL